MSYLNTYTYKQIIKLSFAPIIMMIFTSLYSVVDGLFLSNFAGKDAFAAVGFIMPYLMLFTSVGFMFGTGGSALIAKMLGENKKKEANETFTSLIIFSSITGVLLIVLAILLLRPIIRMQGASDILFENSVMYAQIYLLGTPFCIFQFEFEILYQTAGKKQLGLYSTLISGILNIVLDLLFLLVFKMGIQGAAIATVISQAVGGLIPIVYFSRENNSELRFVKCKMKFKEIGKICLNGSSEMVNNFSIAVVSFVYNIQLLKYAGDNGIAAYGMMSYVNFLFTAIFWGYINAISPVISYQYGAKNDKELHNLLKKSLVLLFSASLIMFLCSELLSKPLSSIFVGYDEELLNLTINGFRIYSFTFLFAGVSVFTSSFFTSLNNGLISAIISFSRVFVFQIPIVLTFPLFLDINGVWISVAIAELLTTILGFSLIYAYRKRYNY